MSSSNPRQEDLWDRTSFPHPPCLAEIEYGLPGEHPPEESVETRGPICDSQSHSRGGGVPSGDSDMNSTMKYVSRGSAYYPPPAAAAASGSRSESRGNANGSSDAKKTTRARNIYEMLLTPAATKSESSGATTGSSSDDSKKKDKKTASAIIRLHDNVAAYPGARSPKSLQDTTGPSGPRPHLSKSAAHGREGRSENSPRCKVTSSGHSIDSNFSMIKSSSDCGSPWLRIYPFPEGEFIRAQQENTEPSKRRVAKISSETVPQPQAATEERLCLQQEFDNQQASLQEATIEAERRAEAGYERFMSVHYPSKSSQPPSAGEGPSMSRDSARLWRKFEADGIRWLDEYQLHGPEEAEAENHSLLPVDGDGEKTLSSTARQQQQQQQKHRETVDATENHNSAVIRPYHPDSKISTVPFPDPVGGNIPPNSFNQETSRFHQERGLPRLQTPVTRAQIYRHERAASEAALLHMRSGSETQYSKAEKRADYPDCASYASESRGWKFVAPPPLLPRSHLPSAPPIAQEVHRSEKEKVSRQFSAKWNARTVTGYDGGYTSLGSLARMERREQAKQAKQHPSKPNVAAVEVPAEEERETHLTECGPTMRKRFSDREILPEELLVKIATSRARDDKLPEVAAEGIEEEIGWKDVEFHTTTPKNDVEHRIVESPRKLDFKTVSSLSSPNEAPAKSPRKLDFETAPGLPSPSKIPTIVSDSRDMRTEMDGKVSEPSAKTTSSTDATPSCRERTTRESHSSTPPNTERAMLIPNRSSNASKPSSSDSTPFNRPQNWGEFSARYSPPIGSFKTEAMPSFECEECGMSLTQLCEHEVERLGWVDAKGEMEDEMVDGMANEDGGDSGFETDVDEVQSEAEWDFV